MLVWGLLCGCATRVSVDYDKAVNFAEYHTYVLLAKSEKSTDDARLNSPLIDKRIDSAIVRNLRAKGFGSQLQSPDFQVRYQINLSHEIATDNSGVTMVFGTGMRRSAFGLGYSLPAAEVESYEKGMLTIDIISAETGQLVWRGTSSQRISEAATPEKLDKFFNGLVGEILAKFPPPQ